MWKTPATKNKVSWPCPEKSFFRLCLICMAVWSFLRGVFARSFILVFLSPLFSVCWASEAPKESVSDKTKANEMLKRGLHLGDLYNWPAAAPAFESAEKEFNAMGDKRNAFFAHLGYIRSTSEQRNLPQTTAWLATELRSNPLLRTDKKLRLFCLIVQQFWAWRTHKQRCTILGFPISIRR